MNSLQLIRRLSTQSTIRPISQPINQSITRSFHSSRQSSGINDFFHGAASGKTGREWSCADLRLKSFDDLHKLWFVLLKERNMLFTHQQFCKSSMIQMQNPERFHKVKKSMAHIKRVLHERHLAVKEASQSDTQSSIHYNHSHSSDIVHWPLDQHEAALIDQSFKCFVFHQSIK